MQPPTSWDQWWTPPTVWCGWRHLRVSRICRYRAVFYYFTDELVRLEQPFSASQFSAVHYTCGLAHRFYHAPHCHHYLTRLHYSITSSLRPSVMSRQLGFVSGQREGRARLGVTSGDERRALNARLEIAQHARPVGGEAQVVRRRALLDETVAKSHASPRRSRVLCSSAPLRRHAPRRHTSATPSRPTRCAHLAVAKPIRALP